MIWYQEFSPGLPLTRPQGSHLFVRTHQYRRRLLPLLSDASQVTCPYQRDCHSQLAPVPPRVRPAGEICILNRQAHSVQQLARHLLGH